MEISAELDPAVPTSPKTLVLFVLPLCWRSAPRPVWQTGRESMFLVQEITIPGDFTSTSSGDSVKPLLCFERPSGFGLVLQGCCHALLSRLWGLCPQCQAMCPSVPGLGCGLASWGHKSHFAHMLHPSSMSSLLSSALLLCTSRGKVIFCLKHCLLFFNLRFYSRRQMDCFVSLEKRGWGSWGKSGKSLWYLCSSHGWAQWLSPHQTLPPLHDPSPKLCTLGQVSPAATVG